MPFLKRGRFKMANFKDKIYFEEPILDRFYNGVSPEETVLARFANKAVIITLRNLFSLAEGAERLVSKEEDIWIKDITQEMHILSREGDVKILQIIRRKVYESILRIETEDFITTVSKSHEFLVVRENTEIILRANALKKGDILITLSPTTQPQYQAVKNIEFVKEPQFVSLYGLLTDTGTAYINGIFGKSY